MSLLWLKIFFSILVLLDNRNYCVLLYAYACVGVCFNKVWSVPCGEYKRRERGHEPSSGGIQAVSNNLIGTLHCFG